MSCLTMQTPCSHTLTSLHHSAAHLLLSAAAAASTSYPPACPQLASAHACTAPAAAPSTQAFFSVSPTHTSQSHSPAEVPVANTQAVLTPTPLSCRLTWRTVISNTASHLCSTPPVPCSFTAGPLGGSAVHRAATKDGQSQASACTSPQARSNIPIPTCRVQTRVPCNARTTQPAGQRHAVSTAAAAPPELQAAAASHLTAAGTARPHHHPHAPRRCRPCAQSHDRCSSSRSCGCCAC